MPITPQQAATRSTATIKALVTAHEEAFDGKLAAEYAGSGRVIVEGSLCPSIPTHVRAKVVSELKRRYAEAGWSLERKDDQRDGPWWELRAVAARRVPCGCNVCRNDCRSPLSGCERQGYGSLDQAALDEHGR